MTRSTDLRFRLAVGSAAFCCLCLLMLSETVLSSSISRKKAPNKNGRRVVADPAAAAPYEYFGGLSDRTIGGRFVW